MPNKPALVARASPIVTAALTLAACSAGAASDEARDAALQFVAAEHDPATVCRLLAPQTREQMSSDGSCAEAVEKAELSGGANVTDVQVAGHSARVVTSDDVLFLALFDDGWKVTAAGCKAQGTDVALPYDCDVKGD